MVSRRKRGFFFSPVPVFILLDPFPLLGCMAAQGIFVEALFSLSIWEKEEKGKADKSSVLHSDPPAKPNHLAPCLALHSPAFIIVMTETSTS